MASRIEVPIQYQNTSLIKRGVIYMAFCDVVFIEASEMVGHSIKMM